LPDLDSRFRSIREARPPDLWHEIEQREPQPIEAPQAPRKLGVVVLALVVASFGIGLVVHAFGTVPRKSPSISVPSVTPSNGDIYYVRSGGAYAPEFGSIHPDGTGSQTALVSTDDVHYHRIAFSPDGMMIAFADSGFDRSGIAVAEADGSNVHRLTDGLNDTWPSWSPDGTKIAFSGTAFDPNIGRCSLGVDFDCATDIYVIDADGSGLVRLTTAPGPDYRPVWSPDGTRIAFVSYREGHGSVISVMDADGADAHPISSGAGDSDSSPTWSPDGSMIVFASIRNENWAIYGVAPDGTGEHVIKAGDSIDDPVWSPDGSRIAYTAADPVSGLISLYTMRPDGSDVTLVGTDRPHGIAAYIIWRPVLVAASSAPS
jgi:Tol biopolymer transport system component